MRNEPGETGISMPRASKPSRSISTGSPSPPASSPRISSTSSGSSSRVVRSADHVPLTPIDSMDQVPVIVSPLTVPLETTVIGPCAFSR